MRLLDTDRDFETIESWYKARKLAMPPKSSFPKIGYIIPGIAAGFLIQTDACWGILEPFVSNPNASKVERDWAICSVMNKLMEVAKDLGYTSVFGFSTHTGMVKRAVGLGFTVIEHDSLTIWKDLI